MSFEGKYPPSGGGGSGTVTSITAGVGLTGGTITTSGTIALAVPVTVPDGGTGDTSLILNGVLFGNGTSAVGVTAAGTTGQVLTGVTSGAPVWASPATSGTVTSVAVSGGTTGLTTSGGPITSSGTITLAGTLSVANGGTGDITLASNGILYGNGTNAIGATAAGTTGQVLTGVTSGAPVWASPATSGTVTSVAAAVPAFLSISGSPITTSGTLTIGLSGTALPVANGGSGQTTFTTDGVLYGNGTSGFGVTAAGTTGQVLTGVTSGAPVWASPATSGTVTSVAVSGGTTGLTTSGGPITSSGTITLAGTLSVANGGTGDITLASNGILYGNGTNAIGATAAGTTGQVLTATTSGAPTWQPNAAAATATPTTTGLVSSYFPVVQSAIKSVSSAAYTILTTDGFEAIIVSTGASSRAITLPAASANTGRIIQFKKSDSGSGAIVVTPAGSDTIDGAAFFQLNYQYDSVSLACDGTTWNVIGTYFINTLSASRLETSSVSVTNNTDSNVLASALTIRAGTWDLSSFIGVNSVGSSTFNISTGCISTTSATVSSNNTVGVQDANGQIRNAFNVGPITPAAGTSIVLYLQSRITLTSDTPYYLCVNIGSAGATVFGSLTARRVA